MIEVLKLKEMVEEKLEPYRHTFREMRRQKKKKSETEFKYFGACLPPVSCSPPFWPLPRLRQQDQPFFLLLSLLNTK